MPFNRPTLDAIRKRLQAEADLRLPGSDARLRRSPEGVMTSVFALASHEMHGFIQWVSRQILPDTADSEFLDRHADIWGIARKGAERAAGRISFTGANDTVIPIGTTLRRSDDVEYETTEEVEIAAGTATAAAQAVLTGASGNAEIGAKVYLTSPIAGLSSEGLIASNSGTGMTGGTDIESDEDLRQRVIERIQQPPHGGAAHDYNAWAKQVPGVTRAWVYPLQYGAGTVGVTFVMDDKAGTIIPSAPEVEEVQTYIDARRPVTAEVTVFAPTEVEVDLEIHINPNTEAVRTAIRAELEDLFTRESVPGGTLLISHIREAVSIAQGEFDHVVVSPAANVVMTFGQIGILGDITWGAL